MRVQGMVAQLVVNHFRVGQAIGENLGVGRRLALTGEIVGSLVISLLARVGGQVVINHRE